MKKLGTVLIVLAILGTLLVSCAQTAAPAPKPVPPTPVVPVATLPATTGTDNSGTKLVATFNVPLYVNGVALADAADVKTHFAFSGTAGDYTSATYSSSAKTVTFVFSTTAADTNTLTVATALTSDKGVPAAAKVYTYATTGTIWTTN